MHPFSSQLHPYWSNFQPQPTIENYRWENVWVRSWSQSQSQFVYHGPTPHFGPGFQNVGGRHLPQQTAGPSNPIVAPERRPLPKATCEICGVKLTSSDKSIEQHNNGKRHRRMLKLHEESEKQKAINRQESGETPTSLMNSEIQPQTSKLHEKSEKQKAINRQGSGQMPTSLSNLEVQPETVKKSKINGCLVENVSSESTVDKHKDYPKKNIGETTKVSAKKSQGEPRYINRQESGKKLTSLLNSEVKPHTVKKSKRNGCLVEKVSSESIVDKHKDYLQKNTGETSKVSAEKPQGEPRDINRQESGKTMTSLMNSEVQPHTSKLCEESKEQKAINRQESGQSPNSLMNLEVQPQTVMKSKTNGCLVEKVSSESTVDKHKDYLKKDTGETSKVPAEKPQGEPRDKFVAQGHGFKRKIRGSKGDENKRKRRATESSKPDVNALSNCVESIVQEPAAAPPEGPSALQEFSTAPAVGSSFESQIQLVLQPELEPQVSETIAHYESLNLKDQANVQPPSSVAVEFDAAAGSSANTETAYGSFKAEEKMDVLPTEKRTAPLSQVSLSCCEIRGSRGDEYKKKRKRKRRATELSKPDISALSNCVESPVQEPAVAPPEGPLALQEFLPVLAVGSSFEPQIQLDLQPELEPQVSETIAHYESLNPTDQANVQLPSQIAVEFDAPAGSGTNTETADGSFKADEKMDVLTTEKRTAPLSQVNVCLKCGSQGFQEALVFCNKCHTYALHRYCLDGPVIFIEDVTWFCEDCEPAVVERINNDKTSITQVEENKQQQQNILSKTKDQLYDRHNASHHGLSQCNNGCDGENKFKKECQVVLNDAANSSEESVTDKNSQAALKDAANISEETVTDKNSQAAQKDAANSSEETVTDKNSQAALKDVANSSEETVADKNSQEATSNGPNFVELEGDVVAEPSMDPTWRGSFFLHNQSTGTVCGLLAHLSSLACCQVMEETRLLPEGLSVELLQRSAVWPNCFKKCGPNHDSIALYFFPENERAERDFDKLVDDIIHFDQAMRVVLDQAELLVFPSTLLPIQYWRFQAKYYLWGVFRAKQTSSTTSGVVCG